MKNVTIDCQSRIAFGVFNQTPKAHVLGPTGRPYVSPGQRPGIESPNNHQAPTGNAVTDFGTVKTGIPQIHQI
jgi:hypothetical protein